VTLNKFKFDGFVVFRLNDSDESPEREVFFAQLDRAMDLCEQECGNRSYRKLFPTEDTYLFGPGNGETNHMIKPSKQTVQSLILSLASWIRGYFSLRLERNEGRLPSLKTLRPRR
jgi:hypothetical protein